MKSSALLGSLILASCACLWPYAAHADENDSAQREPAPSRSAVELAFGPAFVARKLETKALFGSALVGELAAPGLFELRRYRPSLRLSASFASSYDDLVIDHIGHSPKVRNTNYLGAGLDLCPVGIAAVSTRRFDLTLSACGTMNAGTAGALDQVFRTDAGGLGRVTAQIGSKRHFRGFVDVSGGALARLGSEHLPGQDEGRGPMWTFALGGGIVFP